MKWVSDMKERRCMYVLYVFVSNYIPTPVRYVDVQQFFYSDIIDDDLQNTNA